MSDITGVDPYLDRAAAARDITESIFPATPRGLREWDSPTTIIIGGRACARRSEWRAEAERRLREAQFDGRSERLARTSRARQVLAARRNEQAA
jgi:hypothetical protein